MRIFFLTATFFYTCKVWSQTAQADTLNYLNAVKNAKTLYQQFIDPPTGLYNGAEYADYAYQITEGHPFFESADFNSGSVVYDGILYENVRLLYDIVKEEVVIKDPFEIYKIALINERLSEFTLSNHTFVRLVENDSGNAVINTGFYEVLYSGTTGVYKKQKKKVQENVAFANGIKRYVVETSNYFILKDHKFYPVNNKRSLLSLFKNKDNEIQQFMRKNKLNMRKNKGIALTKAVAYYDEINK